MAAGRRRALGLRGEAAAQRWYCDRGYHVLARNWRCPEGEIDLILRTPSGAVVICEVKTRSSADFGTPFEAVTPVKRRRLRLLASRWLASDGAGHGYGQVRFDVAAITVGPAGVLAVEVMEEAF